MKRLFYLFLIIGLVATSCQKPAEVPTMQDVVFKATPTAIGNFKADEPICDNDLATYALIDIDGEVIRLDIFYLNDVIYTETIKLPPGDYTVNSFGLYDVNDDLVQATPLTDSEYDTFIETHLPFDFKVDAFFKTEIPIHVLCFVPNFYTNFGFAWFTVEEVTVREVCFFGDFCTKYYLDYGASLYADQVNGLQHDMPAIFKIDVYRFTQAEPVPELIITYDNEYFDPEKTEPWLGEGAPLCVKYPDFKDSEDFYIFELSILVKVGSGFDYVYFHSFATKDADPLPGMPGDDNVMDFVLGSCVVGADLTLAPYMNLPLEAKMDLSLGTNSYFNVYLTDFLPDDDGFDIVEDSIYAGFCADRNTGIYLTDDRPDPFAGVPYVVSVHSSLYPDLLPDGAMLPSEEYHFDNLNWLRNNLHLFDCTWQDCQTAMWLLNDQVAADITTLTGYEDTEVGPVSELAVEMYNAAKVQLGYMPPVGGWAAVLFLTPPGSAFHYNQLIFTMVDP